MPFGLSVLPLLLLLPLLLRSITSATRIEGVVAGAINTTEL